MAQTQTCFLCQRELEGAIEVVTVKIGRLPLACFRETTDCNWTRCKTCGRPICKPCSRGKPSFCCESAFSIRREEVIREVSEQLGTDQGSFRKAA